MEGAHSMDIRVSDTEIIIKEDGLAEPEINTALLERVATRIETEYRGFHMRNWCQTVYEPRSWWQRLFNRPKVACGTTRCVAGWICALSGEGENVNIPARAQRLAGLTLEQATRLF